ncbi:hypothetical protein, partial [Prosthecobacter sp.]|uniref:hypothetical protein n=1 Tax=Prosthecobacter sp. TaxID=1965333 RepID=UPI00248A28D3
MTDKIELVFTDRTRLRANVVGLALGCSVFLFRGMIDHGVFGVPDSRIQILVMLALALASGILAPILIPGALVDSRLATGIGGRIGLRAGIRAAITA